MCKTTIYTLYVRTYIYIRDDVIYEKGIRKQNKCKFYC